jgi:FAD/FMN-containing dehydrogenase
MIDDNVLTKLVLIVGNDHVISNEEAKLSYEIDWRGNFSGRSLIVVKPQTTHQIQQIIKVCQELSIAIIPQGGNTSLCGGGVPVNDYDKPQIILNLSLLNKILEVDTANNSITMEAGCTLANVITAADQQERYFPLSIASENNCQIGGNIATNAGGIHVIKYGMMRDLVLGLEAILPNGEIVNQLTTLRKNNTNFDLKQLFIGSEGTLGIITKAILKLYPKPEKYITGLIGIADIEQAVAILSQLQSKFSVCAFEIIHSSAQNIYNTYFPDSQFPISAKWLILFEFETASTEAEEFELETLFNIFSRLNINLNEAIIADTSNKRDNLWHIRENIPLAEKMHGYAVKHDISLPISQLESFIQSNSANILKYHPHAQIIMFGHLGDGNLHYNVQLDNQLNTKTNEAKINEIVYNDVIKHGGSISAEHGIGQLKLELYRMTSDPQSYLLAKQIKQLIDPNNILNPGKIF